MSSSHNNINPSAVSLPNPPHDLITKLQQPTDDDLLDLINKQQCDDYRNLKFDIKDKKFNNNYKNRVGFDTINIDYADDDNLPEEPSFNDTLSPDRGRSRSSKSPSPRVMSPYGSSIDNSLSYFDPNEIKRLLGSNLKYPTTPIITHRGCTYTRIHRKFEDLTTNKIKGRRPKLRGRVILVYISGRKHTWVALDWVLRYFIEDGDTVIVVSAIDSKRLVKTTGSNLGSGSGTPRNTPLSPTRVTFNPKTAKMRLRQRNSPEYMATLTQNIMKYIMEVINPKVIAKVTLELAVGKTREILQEMYKLYEPNLVCTATKINPHVSAPLRSWTSNKLTDRLVYQFPLPLIIVPAMNMLNMELKLQNEINFAHSDHTKDWNINDESNLGKAIETKLTAGQSGKSPTPASPTPEPFSDTASVQSDNTIDSDNSSITSTESYDSYEEISKLFYNYKKDVKNTIHSLKKNPIDENYFANFLINISDKSVRFCDDVRDVDPDFKGKGAKLARALTGSASFGILPYKTKSLIPPVETKAEPASPTKSAPSFKDIKRNLQMNAASPPPLIKVDNASPSPTPVETSRPPLPHNSSLKFVDLETPKKKTTSRPRSNSTIRKVLSHQDNTEEYFTRPSLEPSASHPDFQLPASCNYDGKSSPKKKEDENKKKKKRFWGKIFK